MVFEKRENRFPSAGSKRVGLLSFSDGRPFVSRDTAAFVQESEDRLAAWLRESGYEVVRASGPVTSNELAVSEARRLRAASPGATIFNYPVWAFPHFTMLAQDQLPGPVILFSNVDPQYPGMVGMLAAAGGARPDRPPLRARLGRRRRPAMPRASRRAPARSDGGRGAPRLDLRPHRRAPDGHVHRGLQHRRLDAAVRHRRRGDRPVGDRPPRRRCRHPARAKRARPGSSSTRPACTTTASG